MTNKLNYKSSIKEKNSLKFMNDTLFLNNDKQSKNGVLQPNKKGNIKDKLLKTCIVTELKDSESLELQIKLLASVLKIFTKSEILKNNILKDHTNCFADLPKKDKNRILEFLVNFSQKEDSKVIGSSVQSIKVITLLDNKDNSDLDLSNTDTIFRSGDNKNNTEIFNKTNTADEVKIDKEIDIAFIFIEKDSIKIQNKNEIVILRYSSIIRFEIEGLSLRFFAIRNKIIEMKFMYNQSVDKFVERLNYVLYRFEPEGSIEINLECSYENIKTRHQNLEINEESEKLSAYNQRKVTFKSDKNDFRDDLDIYSRRYTDNAENNNLLENWDTNSNLNYKNIDQANFEDTRNTKDQNKNLHNQDKKVLKNYSDNKNSNKFFNNKEKHSSLSYSENPKNIAEKARTAKNYKCKEDRKLDSAHESHLNKILQTEKLPSIKEMRAEKVNMRPIYDEKLDFSFSLESFDNIKTSKASLEINESLKESKRIQQEDKKVNLIESKKKLSDSLENADRQEQISGMNQNCSIKFNETFSNTNDSFESEYSIDLISTPERSFKGNRQSNKSFSISKGLRKNKKKSSVLLYKPKNQKKNKKCRDFYKKELILKSNIFKKINSLYKMKVECLKIKQEKAIKNLQRSKKKLLERASKKIFIFNR